jgi:hypothetical protein
MAIKYTGTNSGSERVGFYTRTSTVQNVRVAPTVPVASDGKYYIRLGSLYWAVRAFDLGLSGAPAGLWAKVGISGGGLASTVTSSLLELTDGAGSTANVSARTFTLTDTNVELTTGDFTLTLNIYTNSAGTTRPDNIFNTADDTRMGLNSGVSGDYYGGYSYFNVPTAPTSVAVASVTDTSASLTWTAPSDTGGTSITGYYIEYSSDNFATSSNTTSTTNSKTITGLTSNTTYKFRVYARNVVTDNEAGLKGSAVSNTATGTTALTVTAPTASVITPTVNSDTSISLSWTASTDNGNGGTITYKLYQKSGTGSYALIYGPASSPRTYTSTGLSASTTYTYKVESINNTYTTTSTEVNATTQAAKTVPGVPSVTAGTITGTSVQLNWSAVNDGNDPPVTYYIEKENTFNGGTYTQIATTTSLTYTASGLTGSTDYRFRVRAGNATGYSGYGVLVATTLAIPVWVTTSLPVGTVSVAYSATLNATGVQASNGYSIVSGTLPAGLSLNTTTGAITGTPTTNGTSNLTFRATNANGTADFITYISIGQATAIKVRNAGNTAWVPVTATKVRNATDTGWNVVIGVFIRNATNTGWTNLG